MKTAPEILAEIDRVEKTVQCGTCKGALHYMKNFILSEPEKCEHHDDCVFVFTCVFCGREAGK